MAPSWHFTTFERGTIFIHPSTTYTCECIIDSRRRPPPLSDVWSELKISWSSKTCLHGRVCVHESCPTEELPAEQQKPHQFLHGEAVAGKPETLHVTWCFSLPEEGTCFIAESGQTSLTSSTPYVRCDSSSTKAGRLSTGADSRRLISNKHCMLRSLRACHLNHHHFTPSLTHVSAPVTCEQTYEVGLL
jgi:hypothetical protein